ncbi:MAG: hypothetical protein KIT18_04180 [Burkholderiales bacterium]|nr:hypothetical protein [Burkholderiales bacterium]
METLYRWRVQEKDKRGRVRWRIVRSPMTEETARFWAANNNRIIERIDVPVTVQKTSATHPRKSLDSPLVGA